MDKPINQITTIKSLEQVRSYLQNKSQLNLGILMDKNNSTLLHFAAFKNDLPRMKLFIKHYKQFTQLNHGTGLYKGQSSFSDKLRAWVNSQNKQGYIPLLYAALHGNIQMIQFLQQCGSNMNYRTTKKQNVLFMCIQHNKIKALIYFIESNNNYNVNQQNINGDTILHYACRKGYTQLVSYLLTVGADINAVNNQGETPLLVATNQSKKQVIKLLLIKGANRGDKNKNGQTSLQVAKLNHKQDIAKILDDQYSCCDKIRIKCNKKIVYQPQKQSYLYSLYFIVLFHLFFLPINILSQFSTDQKYIKFIPFIGQGIYQIIIIVLYILLLRKTPRKKPMNLIDIDGPFCSQCKRKTNEKVFHCYICERCVYRYDHHCPWINNCVGAHNVGKFTLFLFVLILGLAQVIFCCISLIVDKDHSIVRYRKGLEVPDAVHLPLNIVTTIFSVLLVFGLLNLLIDQIKNLTTNSTGFERQMKQKSALKKAELLSSQVSLNQSMQQDFDQQQNQKTCNCCSNCMTMITENY